VSDIDIKDLIDRLTVRQCRKFALWCAERVRHLTKEAAPADFPARHRRGEATDEEWKAVKGAQWAAAAARGAVAAETAESSQWVANWTEVTARAARIAIDTERDAQIAELKRMLKEAENG
jgi:hypothetical protein